VHEEQARFDVVVVAHVVDVHGNFHARPPCRGNAREITVERLP
jgi:hypothetical protein